MEATILSKGNIGIIWGYNGIMENEMETAI